MPRRFALPARGLLNRERIAGLHAAQDGKLWIFYAAGRLSVLHPDGRLDDIPDAPVPIGGIDVVAVDRDGSVAMRSGPPCAGANCRP